MSKLSLKDKFDILIEVSKSSNVFVIAFIILLVLAILFLTTSKKNEKRTKIIYIASSVFLIIFAFTSFNGSLADMFEYMMDNFFIVFYFPNLAIYTFSIIISNIILLVSIFNYKVSKAIKRINIAVYIVINYLLILILSVINNNKLDVFSQTSVYGNEKATALIELSSLIFIIWVIFLILYRLILIYLKKEYKPPVKRLIRIKRVKKLPDNFIPKKVPDYAYQISKKINLNKKNQDSDLLKAYDQMFTLDDYKVLLKMLKEQKEKEKLEKLKIEREKQEKLRKEEEKKEENKFAELEALYRSMR